MAAAKVGLQALLVLGLSGLALAEKPPSPWATVKTPAPGTPRAIGDYSGGCVQGAQELPLDGPGFQTMHPSRVRHFGHPDLLAFITALGAQVKAAGLAPVMVGDLSQPRGGRASGGHASHQTGLDVDLWFWLPDAAQRRTLSETERETIKARSILDGKTQSMQSKWAERVAKLLRLTADDRRVERVFVHPIIKRELCANAGADRAWLSNIRPSYGHDDHMHVRLACPAGSPDCLPQAKIAAGDGCGEELDWWFSPEASADRDKERKRYREKVVRGPQVPQLCLALLDDKTAPTKGKEAVKTEATAQAEPPAAAPATPVLTQQ